MTWINVAIAVYGVYEGNRQRRAGNRERERQQAQWDQDMAGQRERQAFLDKMAMPLGEHGIQDLDMVRQWLRQVGSGDRNATMQAVAPQINAMTEQSRGAFAAQRNAAPRGAGIPGNPGEALQGNVNNLLFQARTDALGGLGNLGGLQAQLAMQAMGQSGGLTNNMLQLGLQSRDQMFNQGYMSGQGQMQLLNQLGTSITDAWNAYQRRRTPPTTGQTQPQTQPNAQQSYPNSGLLDNFGRGSSLGFGPQSSVGSTYAAPSNPYGIDPYNHRR